MEKLGLLYEGKGKKLYATSDANRVIAEFKDDLTAFNAQKKGSESGKGALNCQISALLFQLLAKRGIQSHFIENLSPNTMLCQKVEIIPLEVVVRNTIAGSLAKRLGKNEGERLPFGLVELYYKNDALNDPLINDEHCVAMGIVSDEKDIAFIKHIARKINDILREFFDTRGINLVDFKVEFGRNSEGRIILADEISPDSCRFWDKESGKKLDKDIFRQNLGNVVGAYQEILERIN